MRLLIAGGAAFAVLVIGAGVIGPMVSQRGTGPGSSVLPSVALSSPSPSVESATPGPTFAAPIVGRIEPTDVATTWSATAASLWTPALAPDGRIWVPSNENDQIRIYDQTGRLVEKWGTSGAGDGQFKFGAGGSVRNGAGVVFAPDGSFFVLDSGNFRVQQFSPDRKFVGAFGSYGSEPGQFTSAVAIGLDDAGNLYVSDGGQNVVEVFTTGGTYVRTVARGAAGDGLWGSGPGWFITTRLTDNGAGAIEYHADGTVQGGWDLQSWSCDPSGVTRDQTPRNIYVTCPSHDVGIGYLFRFDQTGTLLRAWRIDGAGVAVTPDGTSAFVVSRDGTSLSRYALDPPAGG
jgi:sugar lactone lactonase YvrE